MVLVGFGCLGGAGRALREVREGRMVLPDGVLAGAPVVHGLDFFHGESGKDQVRVFGLRSEELGFVQGEAEQVAVAVEIFTELIHDPGAGLFDLGDEALVALDAKIGEGVFGGGMIGGVHNFSFLSDPVLLHRSGRFVSFFVIVVYLVSY